MQPSTRKLELRLRAELDDAVELFESAFYQGVPISIEQVLASASKSEFDSVFSKRFQTALLKELSIVDFEIRCRRDDSEPLASLNSYWQQLNCDDKWLHEMARAIVVGCGRKHRDWRQLVDSVPRLRSACEQVANELKLQLSVYQLGGDTRSTDCLGETQPSPGRSSATTVGAATPPQNREWFPALGQKIGRFQITSVLGKGSFGTVFLAKDPELDRSVAIKIPRSSRFRNQQIRQRFLAEAKAVAKLSHPGLVPVFEVGSQHEVPYLVTEFVRGQTLESHLAEHNVNFTQAASLVQSLAETLDFAHNEGVIHRDIKPSNIMLDMESPSTAEEDFDSFRARLLDFGLADWEGGFKTDPDHLIGTPAYMSPEQAAGNASSGDRRMDVYSLGVVFFEILTNHLPFRGSPQRVLDQVVNESVPKPTSLNEQVPVELETICLKCLEKAPGNRYQTAGDLARDLGRFLAGKEIAARPIGWLELSARRVQQHPLTAISISIAVACTVALFGAMLTYWSQASAQARQQRLLKIEALTRADQQRTRVQQLRQRLYLSQMNIVQHAVEENETGIAVDLLEQFVPAAEAGTETAVRHVDFRGPEWYYWWNQTHQFERIALELNQQIRDVEIRPDGACYAVCSDSRDVIVLSADDHKVIQQFRLKSNGVDICWSADGAKIAVSEVAGVSVFKLPSGQQTFRKKQKLDFNGRVVFLTDNLLAVQRTGNRSMEIWDIDRNERQFKFHQSVRIRPCLALSSDGNQIVFGDKNRLLQLQISTSGLIPDQAPQLLGETGADSVIVEVLYLPQRECWVTLEESGIVRVWDATTNKLSKTIDPKLAAQATAMTAVPETSLILIGDRAKQIYSLDLEDSKYPWGKKGAS